MRISIKWYEILTLIKVWLGNVKHLYVVLLIFVFVMGIFSQSLSGKQIKSNENSNSIVVDVCLEVSNEAVPPTTPTGYTLIGYWDVESVSEGTDGSTGSYMMGLYVKYREIGDTISNYVEDIQLKASNSSKPPLPTFRYSYMGCWDVEGGGSKGTDGSTGSYMMGLYIKTNCSSPSGTGKTYISSLMLKASDSPTPPSTPDGFTLIGYWDVQGGGSKGTDGSTGSYMMGMYASFRNK